jgi:hypothetical protein
MRDWSFSGSCLSAAWPAEAHPERVFIQLFQLVVAHHQVVSGPEIGDLRSVTLPNQVHQGCYEHLHRFFGVLVFGGQVFLGRLHRHPYGYLDMPGLQQVEVIRGRLLVRHEVFGRMRQDRVGIGQLAVLANELLDELERLDLGPLEQVVDRPEFEERRSGPLRQTGGQKLFAPRNSSLLRFRRFCSGCEPAR